METLGFCTGHEILLKVETRESFLRDLARYRIRAARLVAASDDPTDSTVGELLEDAEKCLEAARGAAKDLPATLDLRARPSMERLSAQARALRLALGAVYHDAAAFREDLAAIDELAYGLESELAKLAGDDRSAEDGDEDPAVPVTQ